MSAFNRLTDLQKMHYGSISYGGSNGDIVPSDTVETNKYIGLYCNDAGDIKIRKPTGAIQTLTVTAASYHPVAFDTVYATGTTATSFIGLCKWDEAITDGIID